MLSSPTSAPGELKLCMVPGCASQHGTFWRMLMSTLCGWVPTLQQIKRECSCHTQLSCQCIAHPERHDVYP